VSGRGKGGKGDRKFWCSNFLCKNFWHSKEEVEPREEELFPERKNFGGKKEEVGRTRKNFFQK
jgi:hypothetical protein